MKRKVQAIKPRFQKDNYDITLLFPVLLLVGIGIVMVYSASSELAMKKFSDDYYFLKRQALFALAGVLVLIICRRMPYRLLGSFTYPLLILAFGLLIMIQVPGFGVRVGGALRWLSLGGFSFQPSELARFALIIYLAYSMSRKKEMLKDFYIGFLPHIIVLGIFTALIILQPDFGTVIILGTLTWIMLFIGGVRLFHLVSPLIIVLPVLYYMATGAEYRIRRIMSFMDPWQYSADAGYQIVHSLMAFGSGGIWGSGIGKSYQKLFYLPEPHTDFIFSVIGEELGLLGVMAILGLYLIILWRGINIARHSSDAFGSFVAAGITTALGLQVCINTGVALGLLPTKGLTLPFLSYGGTSLLISMASIGVLMNIGAGSR